MFNFIIIYYVIFVLNVFTINGQISDKRLCANLDCTEPISIGKTLMRYGSPDIRILSFAPNEDVTIYSKSAGSRADLWGAEIKGKRGYVPRSHIREYKILKKDVKYLIDTEDNKTSTPEVPSKIEETKQIPSPDPVQQAYEIVDGTTIYKDAEEVTTQSFVDNPKRETDNLSHEHTEQLKISQDKQVDKTPPDINQEGKDDRKLEAEKLPEDDLLSKFENKDESLVNNVFSSFKNWINEGSGSNGAVGEEEEDEDGEDDEEDGEVEDEDEEYEDEEETIEDMQKHKKVNDKKDINVPEDLKQNNINVETPPPVDNKIVEEKVIENNKETVKLSEENLEDLEQKNLNIEKIEPASTKEDLNIPKDNLITNEQQKEINLENLQDILKDAGIHDQYTTEQPNYEIPSPVEPLTEEVTPNPLETILTPPQSVSEIIKEDVVQLESLKEKKESFQDDMKKPDTLTEKNNLDDIKVFPENLTSPEKQEETQLNEQPEKVVESDKSVPEDPINKENELKPLEAEEVTSKYEEVEQNVEKQDFDQENNQLKDDILLTEQPTETNPLLENATEAPQDSSGIFSGIYSSMFGNSNSTDNLPSESNDQAILKDTPKEISIQKETISVEEQLEQKPEEDIQEKIEENVQEKFDDNVQEKFEENVQEKFEENIEEKVEENVQETLEENVQGKLEEDIEVKSTESNEPSARDILWGSSIRKEIGDKHQHDFDSLLSRQPEDELSCAANPSLLECLDNHKHSESENTAESINYDIFSTLEFPPIAYEVLTVLVIAAVTIVVFLWGYMYIEKSRQEGPLIAKINDLQKLFLVNKQENESLTEKLKKLEEDAYQNMESVSNEVVQTLKDELLEAHNSKIALEEQLQNLEKELENSTEVGLELNRMLSNILSSENGSDMLVANIEQLQRQLVEQQSTINTYNENLSIKETENHELRLELEISNTKVTDLQGELNKMALNLLKIEEDKEQSQSNYEAEINSLKEQLEQNSISFKNDTTKISEELRIIKQKYEETQRDLDIKTNEYILLKENINKVGKIKNNDESLKSLLDLSSIKAELIQLKKDNEVLTERFQQEIDTKTMLEKQVEVSVQDARLLKAKYDEADKEKLEAQTKLEVLSNYFKEREAQLQKELNKQESMWIEKQGEATSTIERIKYMQEELQNYKSQNESLKQEIVAQEVQMKSQISVLEKKVHENWMAVRQAERKLEDAKHEAAQLRNRLTLRERTINDEKTQNRLQSPLEQNGELPVSPLHMTNDTAASPPLLYGTRDHLTTSPPLPPGLPSFLPPPPGVPFMPPPLGGGPMPLLPGFLPPPPSMLPGDHRPPPLGRMSSPPLNSRYSPDTRAYSPYSRNSPSPTSDDEYGRSSPPPPMYRGYSPYNRGDERRDFNRPPPPPIRGSTRNNKGVTHSSGSANSNESLEKLNRHNSKV